MHKHFWMIALMASLLVGATVYGSVAKKARKGHRQYTAVKVKQDVLPPTFGGVVSAQPRSRSSIKIQWDTATDDFTAAKDIVYHISFIGSLVETVPVIISGYSPRFGIG